MTVDVDPPATPKENFMIENGVISLLNLFYNHKIKATFFVPSLVAENFPSLMSNIIEQKHEIACHGLKHHPLEATLDANRQFENIKTATYILESITGSKPLGFRAPLFNINKNCWVALYKNGYIYDSSIVCSPFFGKTPLPKKPFFLLEFGKINVCSLIEIPVSVNPLLPFPLGGAYMRTFGMLWSKTGIKLNLLFKTPVTFYIHPKDVVQGVHAHSWWHYRNIPNCLKMLSEILKYAKHCGAKFLMAYELAKLSQERLLEDYQI
jgi:hypothetical protein